MSTYNSAAYIAQAVESVLRQSFKDFELIVVDDGSTDDTADILSSFDDERLVIIAQPNAGYVDAWRTAIAVARAPLLARMDADDISDPGRLEHQLAVSETLDGWSVICTAIELIDANGVSLGEQTTYRRRSRLITSYSMAYLLTKDNPVPHPTVLMTRAAYEKAGGYSTDYYPAEDYDLWVRVACQGGKIYRSTKSCLQYRIHDAATSSTSGGLQAHKASLIRARAKADLISRLSEPDAIRGGVAEARRVGLAARHEVVRDAVNVAHLARRDRARVLATLFLAEPFVSLYVAMRWVLSSALTCIREERRLLVTANHRYRQKFGK